MSKPMSSVFSEIFVNNLFELDSHACRCEKDIKNVVPGEPPETTLKLCGMTDRPIHFSYSDKNGLNLTGDQGRVIMRNVLGHVLALKEDDTDGCIRLIEKIGFLLPVSFENYEAVEFAALMGIIKRIKATVNLMNAIDGKSIYDQIRMETNIGTQKRGPRPIALILILCLTLQPHLYRKAAFEVIGVRAMSIWWR